MARFDSFTDLAEHYAHLTSADAFAGAFGSEIAASKITSCQPQKVNAARAPENSRA